MYGLGGCSPVFRMVHSVDAFTGTAAVHQNDRLPTVGLSLLAFTFDFGDKEIKTFFWRMGGEPWFQKSLFFFYFAGSHNDGLRGTGHSLLPWLSTPWSMIFCFVTSSY